MQPELLIQKIRKIHCIIRDAIIAQCEQSSIDYLSAVERESDDDTIYRIDQISEQQLIALVQEEIARLTPVILIMEGLAEGKICLPPGTDETAAKYRIIVDPIDGTRGLMYQKRSGWILTGVAPNRGEDTSLRDIKLAVQTEIPLVKQHLSDQLWALRGQAFQAERNNRISGETQTIKLSPSKAKSIEHGFAMLSRFFPGARDTIAAIDEEIIYHALGPVKPGKAHCFEDQYISSAGQLYELIAGHDRFNADIRPWVNADPGKHEQNPGITCHPYDLCTELIAREAGVFVTDLEGNPLAAKLNTSEEVGWAGYANAAIRQQIEPLLQAALEKFLMAPRETK